MHINMLHIDLRIVRDCETNKDYLQYRELTGIEELDLHEEWKTVKIILGARPNDAEEGF